MKKYPNDASCAKLILKKSSGQLKISVMMFAISIIITMIIGLLYARQYFQYEKDFLENISVKTICVDASFSETSVHPVTSSDINRIRDDVSKRFPGNEISVIPVYTCMGIFMNGKAVNLFAIEQEQRFFIDLEQMENDTVYFTKKQPETVALEISVTEDAGDGFQSNEMKRLLFHTAPGVSEKTPILAAQNQYLTPSMRELPVCFVNMETFQKIVSVLLGERIHSINEKTVNGELVMLAGLYIYVDDLRLVSPVSSFLTTQNYRAYAPADAFDNFGATVSNTFLIFLLSAMILLCMTTVNIFLAFRAFYRVQQKDMGILFYMGFSDKRIRRIYCKPFRTIFLKMMLLCSVIVLIAGMILFAFARWGVLFSFILALGIFLCAIYFAVLKFIIYRYVKQDLLTLLRESKEFE